MITGKVWYTDTDTFYGESLILRFTYMPKC